MPSTGSIWSGIATRTLNYADAVKENEKYNAKINAYNTDVTVYNNFASAYNTAIRAEKKRLT